MFSLDDRLHHIRETFKDDPRIKVISYTGLTVDLCKKEKAGFILRGLRNSSDFNYEQSIAQTNSSLADVESLFIMCSPRLSNISSSIVRDVIRNGGDYTKMVPRSVML